MEIRRCMKCMHALAAGETFCSECGRPYGSVETEPFALKPGTILDGKYLVGEGAEQCGFCSPGLIMNVVAMKKELDHPTDDEIRHYLEGNLCRCTGYMGQMRAIRQYVDEEVEA